MSLADQSAVSVADVIVLDPLLGDDEAAAVLDLWRAFPGYGLYSNEGFPTAFAPELAQRYDAAVNFVRTGGRFGRKDEDRSLLIDEYIRFPAAVAAQE